jgi:hypothetical protein
VTGQLLPSCRVSPRPGTLRHPADRDHETRATIAQQDHDADWASQRLPGGRRSLGGVLPGQKSDDIAQKCVGLFDLREMAAVRQNGEMGARDRLVQHLGPDGTTDKVVPAGDDQGGRAGRRQARTKVDHVLHNANKQIVISSNRSPRQLSTLDDRLRTRFEWGLIADIQPPDQGTLVTLRQN